MLSPVTDPIRSDVLGTAEGELLQTLDLPRWLASLPTNVPTNIVGSPAGLAFMEDVVAALPVARTIPLRDPARSGSDASMPIEAGIASEMLPGSRTIVLDPVTAYQLLLSGKALEQVALKTREALYLPIFAAPTAFRLFYSEGFSFEEPVFDDAAEHRWCWNTSRTPASVYLYSAEPLAGRQVSFDIACGGFGMLVCRVGDQIQAFHSNEQGTGQRFSFDLDTSARIVRIDVDFDGEPLLPDSGLDQRKALFYSFGGVALSPVRGSPFFAPAVHPPEGVGALNDRVVRRLLHLAGFYEVLGLATPWQPVLSLLNARSCFDYQAGFAFRDIYNEARGPVSVFGSARHYAIPVMLYQARRMPSPGSEWKRSSIRLRDLNPSGAHDQA